ncbi:helix-turn-helix domain-containing protein [Candidatus Omnitrophota bacterium]
MKTIELLKIIARKITELRKEKNLTQAELAPLINTAQQNISRIEAGNCNVSIDNLNKIAKALDRELKIDFD